MSKNVLIISEQSFKDFTTASNNIDLKNLTQIIKMVQDRYILPICGTALYDKILTLIPTGELKNDVTFIDYKNLVDDYLTDVLFNYVLAELPMANQYKYVNKGVVIRTSENTTTPDFKELESVMAFYRGYAEWYAERAINYLIANSTLFPEYINAGNDVATIHPVSNQYRSAIYLGNGELEDDRPYSEKYQGTNYKKPY